MSRDMVENSTDPSNGRIDEVRLSLQELSDRMTRDHIEMGCLLWEVDRNEYLREWGYDSFIEYVEGELDFKRRKAEYLRRLYDRFVVELGIDKQRLLDIKWTKASLIEPVVDENNVDQWLSRAVNTPYAQLAREVKAVRVGAGKDSPGMQPTSDGLNMAGGFEGGVEVRKYALYPKQLGNVNRAFELASGTAKSDKPGHLLDMICLEYLAGRGEVSDNPNSEIQTWISSMKKRLPDVTVLAFRGGRDQLRGRLKMMLSELDSED